MHVYSVTWDESIIRSTWIRSRGPTALSPLPFPIRALVLLDRTHCSHVRAVFGSNFMVCLSFNLLVIALALSLPGCPRRSCHSCCFETFGSFLICSNSSSTPSNNGADVAIALSCHVSPRNSRSPRSRFFAILSVMPFVRKIWPPVVSNITRAPSSVNEFVDRRLTLRCFTYNTFCREISP